MDIKNSSDVKKLNRRLILKYIFNKGTTSRLEIAKELNLSFPTVLQNVNELTNLGLINEIGFYGSTGGRKAAIISAVYNRHYSIGIDITKDYLNIILLDLSFKPQMFIRNKIEFVNDKEYFMQIKDLVYRDVLKYTDDSNILGVGISLPGIIDQEKNVLSFSHVLNLRNFNLKTLSDLFPWSCYFENDANAACISEISAQGKIGKNFSYIWLGNSVGGAIIHEGSLIRGKNYHAAEFGHIRIIPNGKKCYCGNNGCLDSYCSVSRLTEFSNTNNLDKFFELVDKNDKDALKFWIDYLNKLILGLINLRMVLDSDIIIGGYLGKKLEPWLEYIQTQVARLDLFAEENGSTISLAVRHYEACALGVASSMINSFLDDF